MQKKTWKKSGLLIMMLSTLTACGTLNGSFCTAYNYVPTEIMTDIEIVKYRELIEPIAANNKTYKKCKK